MREQFGKGFSISIGQADSTHSCQNCPEVPNDGNLLMTWKLPSERPSPER
jgi:hypothetical protein